MRALKLFFSVLLLTAVVTGCKKYEDGPAFALSSKTARLTNTWKVDKATMNGIDVTALYQGLEYTETYEKDGVYSYTSVLGNGSGKWSFENGKEEIRRQGVSGQETVDIKITQLKSSHFSYTYKDGNDEYAVDMIPK